MSTLKEACEELAKDLAKNNRDIAVLLGCSRRSVRRYIGSWRERVKRAIKEERGEDPTKVEPARILLLDVETMPLEAFVWSLQQRWISPDNIKKDWSLISWAAKWLFESKIMSQAVTAEEAKAHDDGSILPRLWDLVNEAHIVVAHNGRRFDVRRINARFAKKKMVPPMSYRIIDTMKEIMRNFDLPSYKLAYVNKLFGLRDKDVQDYELWKKCSSGDAAAIEQMRAYNETDVSALEELYLELRPWIKSHPNVGLFINTDKTVCTNCGNDELSWGGYYYTPAGKYKAFRCEACGAIGRSRSSELSTEEKKLQNLAVAH